MKNFSPIINEALLNLVRSASLAASVDKLQSSGWQFEQLHPGVYRLRHPQVESKAGTVSLEEAVGIQRVLEGVA